MRILGIDPGTRVAGFGVVEVRPAGPRCVGLGVLRASRDSPLPERLASLRAGLVRTVKRFRPSAVALEGAYAGPNPTVAIRMGEARGVVLLVAAEAGLPVHEYPPAAVKGATAGWGAASKEQVARLVQARLGLPTAPTPEDASDALAVALCHAERAATANRITDSVLVRARDFRGRGRPRRRIRRRARASGAGER